MVDGLWARRVEATVPARVHETIDRVEVEGDLDQARESESGRLGPAIGVEQRGRGKPGAWLSIEKIQQAIQCPRFEPRVGIQHQ
jgi:hypothetical protein